MDANVAVDSLWSSVIVPHNAQVIVPSTNALGKIERKLQQQDSNLLQNPLRSSILVVIWRGLTQTYGRYGTLSTQLKMKEEECEHKNKISGNSGQKDFGFDRLLSGCFFFSPILFSIQCCKKGTV